MPVYIRKNVSYTPPSIYNVQLEDDNDFLLDPDQMRDTLPQPYRMINKLLVQLLDNVWDICETKENVILTEARKARPPCLENPEEVQDFDNATALAESADGKFIFVGLPVGLAVMNVETQHRVHSWVEEHAEVTEVKAHQITPDCHLVVTLDDMAVSRVFLFAFNHLFFIKALNENTPDATSKMLCQKCEASKDGDYAGIVLENTATKETWLEVHKLPVEAWQKEVEAMQEAITKHKEEMEEKALRELKMAEKAVRDLKAEEKAQKELKERENNSQIEWEEGQQPEQVTEREEETIESLGAPAASVSTIFEQAKFSMPQVILKVKPPQALPLAANQSSSVASALSKVDTGDVLGVGSNHVLSQSHLDARNVMFRHKHEGMMQYVPKDREEVHLSATFHFVNVSRLLPFGLESNTPENRPVAVVVWWTGSPHLSQYSLLRAGGKVDEDGPTVNSNQNTLHSVMNISDLEYKPDCVWPFISSITCSAASPCSTHLAVGLDNGNLALWDRQIGLNKAILAVSEKSALKSVRFLDPCLFPLDAPMYPPYPVMSATYLLTECHDGTQALFDTCDGSQQIPRQIAAPPQNDDEFQTLLRVIPGLPELVLYVQKNGAMYIKDIGTGASLCQVAIPTSRSLQSPWQPIFAFGNIGQFLFVKAEGKEESEEGEEATDISAVFAYDLKSYTELEPYWSRQHEAKELPVFTTLESRVAALMKERLQQQTFRKPRMQERWGELRSELNAINTLHTVPVDRIMF